MIIIKLVNIDDNLYGSEIILGCMRMNHKNPEEAEHMVMYAYENGINYFDNADIYAEGRCEEIFGKVLEKHTDIRDKMIIQTKCGIVHDEKGRNISFDFSKEHIIKSVEGSLRRLKTDYLDVLLLHRPDALMQPEEVAEAFDELYKSGKVRNFGVSNQNPLQIELLKKYVDRPLKINQMQLSIVECGMVAQGMNTNMTNKLSFAHDGGVYEYSRLNDMTIQAWSPFQKGFFEGTFIDDSEYKELNDCLQALAEKYGVSKTSIASAWILRLPLNTQVVVGTMYSKHLKQIIDSQKVDLTRNEWYELYRAAGHTLP